MQVCKYLQGTVTKFSASASVVADVEVTELPVGSDCVMVVDICGHGSFFQNPTVKIAGSQNLHASNINVYKVYKTYMYMYNIVQKNGCCWMLCFKRDEHQKKTNTSNLDGQEAQRSLTPIAEEAYRWIWIFYGVSY